jgi:uncharacterized protein
MPMSRRHFLKLLGLTAIGSVLGGGAGLAQAYRFGVNHHSFAMPKLKTPLRVVHLSDLHYGMYIRADIIKHWVDATLQESPDLILITGDFLDFTTKDFQPFIQELARLKAPLGVWGVWGNHDYDQGLEYQHHFHAALSDSGIRILVNEGVSIRDDVFLCGCDDLWKGHHDLYKTFQAKPQDQATLFMCHIPDILTGLAEYKYFPDLTLSGHNHGGQVKLPFLGAPFVPSKYGRKFIEGWFTDPMPAFVSRGLGVSSLPIRWNSQPEVVVIDLEPLTI